MVNVADGANVDMGFVALKFSFAHFNLSSFLEPFEPMVMILELVPKIK